MEQLFDEIEGKVFPIIDEITLTQQGFDNTVKGALTNFTSKSAEIIENAKTNATDHTKENLDL